MTDQQTFRIAQVIDYYNKHLHELEKVTDELARKLNIDPEVDTVLVPQTMLYGKREHLPRWMSYGAEYKIKLVRGARKANEDKKG